MKILNLKIKDPQKTVLRNIPFKETGVSFIYGDIQEPSNKKLTINSLGKTLLLKFIDYILGANEDPQIVKKDIKGYFLEAKVSFKNNIFTIIRELGKSDNINIDGKPYTLSEYKTKFEIQRSLSNKQIILSKKGNEIGLNATPQKDDVISCLSLLNLAELLTEADKIYISQDRIKKLKENKKELVGFYGNINIDEISEEIFFIDKEVRRLTCELETISCKIKQIEISDMQQDVVSEYSIKSKELKKLKSIYEKNKIELERLSDFIIDSQKVDISAQHILAIYAKAQKEVPEMIAKHIEDVEKFHKIVFNERKIFLEEKRNSLRVEMEKIQIEISKAAAIVDKLGSIIAVSEVYQESIKIYEKYSTDLQELKYRQGKLSQIKNVDANIEIEDTKLVRYFENASNARQTYEQKIKEYRDYVYEVTSNIYDESVSSYFDIEVRKKHITYRPVVFKITLKGDGGEGMKEVKKNLIDFLLCKYNTLLEFMIQDSSCFNGIDPRQVSGMLVEMGRLAQQTNKQIIISINKYQVGDYKETIDYIVENSAITLSENKKLLFFDF